MLQLYLKAKTIMTDTISVNTGEFPQCKIHSHQILGGHTFISHILASKIRKCSEVNT